LRTTSAPASRVLEVKTENLTSSTYPLTGKAAYMVKDLGIVQAEAHRNGAPIAQATLSLDIYRAVAEAGLGDQDMSVVQALIRRRAQGADLPSRRDTP
jgi:3-hydroxyisobutyrate dehydrogenase-like beta-hydroxyacid dehydrogenase